MVERARIRDASYLAAAQDARARQARQALAEALAAERDSTERAQRAEVDAAAAAEAYLDELSRGPLDPLRLGLHRAVLERWRVVVGQAAATARAAAKLSVERAQHLARRRADCEVFLSVRKRMTQKLRRAAEERQQRRAEMLAIPKRARP
jgi:hypothetical protein